MTLIEAILLGAVQGVTEFLPVSSSGHLVIAEYLLGIQQPSLTFDIFLHFVTFLAVVVFFWREIVALRLRDLQQIGIAILPAGFVGFFLQDAISSLFNSLLVVGIALLITGALNWWVDRVLTKRATSQSEITPKQAFITGLFQAFALIPGISRSGATIAGSIFQGIERTRAFSFSFILVLPLILGATMLQLFEAWTSGELQQLSVLEYSAGGVTAFTVGILSLLMFRFVIHSARFRWFAYYTWVVGSVMIFFSVWG